MTHLELYAFSIAVLSGALRAGTPLLLAGLGELVYERSGVINLGLEGMVLCGALVAVMAQLHFESYIISIIVAAGVVAAIGFLHALLVVPMRTNQIATGLAFVFLLQGITAVIGQQYVGRKVEIQSISLPLVSDIPFIGPVLFQQDGLVYLAILLMLAVAYFLFKLRYGLLLRAVGESAHSAALLGIPVNLTRMAAGCFCGFCCGLAGAHISLAYASQWQENMVAGRGWIALVMVIFARWNPIYLALAAIFFGGLTVLNVNLQVYGVATSPYILGMLPFVFTIILLAFGALASRKGSLGMPLDLGKSYAKER